MVAEDGQVWCHVCFCLVTANDPALAMDWNCRKHFFVFEWCNSLLRLDKQTLSLSLFLSLILTTQ